MRRRPHECMEPLASAPASPPFSLVRLTFGTHHAAASPTADRSETPAGQGSNVALDAQAPTTEDIRPASAPESFRRRRSGSACPGRCSVVDDRQHPEAAAVRELVVNEVGRPAAIGTLRLRDWRACDRDPTPRPAPANRQALLAVEPLGLLAVHRPALAAQKDMQAAVAKPSPLIRELPKPRPQGVVVRASGSIAGRAPVRGHHRPASNGGLISPAMPELMLALASYTTSWGTTRGLSQLRRQ